MTYKAILFDMDGVVVDTQKSIIEFWQDLAGDFGFHLAESDLRDHVFGRHARHTLQALFRQIPPGDYGRVYDRLRTYETTLTYSAVTGVAEILRGISNHAILTALVTGAQSWKARAVLHQLGMDGYFSAVVLAEDVEKGKPDPGCYLLAAERLSAEPRHCIVFEDALSGITAAVRAGMTCVAIAPESDSPGALAAGAVAATPDFRNVRIEDYADVSCPSALLRVGGDISFPVIRQHRIYTEDGDPHG